MRILLCIDDTDDITKRTSTIKIMNYIKKNIMYNKYGESFDITKHYLFSGNGLSFASDNTAICIEADVIEEQYMEVIKDSEDIIKENMSEGSNPGICVIMPEKVINKDELIEFGFRCKEEIVEKSEATMLALRSGLYLKSHGGDGSGVIGALGGAVLRLSEKDGEVYIPEEEN